MAFLEVEGLCKDFGGVRALDRVTVELRAAEILGLIGPNGSGKTTLFNVISGFFAPTAGAVRWRGRDITGLRPDQIVALGVVRTFQSPRVFAQVSALVNVVMARHIRTRAGLLDAVLASPGQRRDEAATRQRAEQIMAFCDLQAVRGVPAARLPYGMARRLGVAIALACEPEVLLLDEPAAGLNGEEKRALAELVQRLHAQGLTIWLVDHNMRFLMGLVQRVVALDSGRKIAEGTPQEVSSNPEVIRVYLGETGFARTRRAG